MNTLIFWLLILSFIAEMIVVVKRNISSKKQDVLLITALFFQMFTSSAFVTRSVSVFSISFFVVSLFNLFAISRFLKRRNNIDEQIARARRSFMWLGLVLMLLLVCGLYIDTLHLSRPLLAIIGSIQLLVAVCLFISVIYSRRFYQFKTREIISEEKLPTVAVCIPARNETDDLPACIESVMNSTYPKLEVLVLDDCSHDKTPEIIKHYAQAGVRFIRGQEPDDSWLAKNAAYAKLVSEAKSDILLFMGVDVRLAPDTISKLVSELGESDMLSVLPRRVERAESAVFIQPIRYWWELGLWRFAISAPPVLSSCWAIRTEALTSLGGFASVKKAIEPEATFARQLNMQDKYQFLISSPLLNVTSNKSPKDQYQTALRKRYPQLKRQPENVLFTIALELVLCVSPFLVMFVSAWGGSTLLFVISFINCTLLGISNTVVYKLSLRRLWPIGLVSFPFLIIADWILMYRSMYAYEFGKVIWKERNICIPLLSIEKSLPKID